MSAAIGYVRLSPGERAKGGLGLASQRAAIAEEAKRRGIDVRAIFEDDKKSGGKPIEKRPGLVAAIDALQLGDVLLVKCLDRLSRGDPVQGELIHRLVLARAARVVSCAGEGTGEDSETAIGRFHRRIMEAVAELERGRIAERTRDALAEKKKRGERTGGVPYGWRVGSGGKLEEVLEETRAIALMKRWRAKGASFPWICEELERREIASKSGGRWYPATVRKILLAS